MVVRYNAQAFDDEEDVRKKIESIWKVRLLRTKAFSSADFLIEENSIITGAVEIKRRNHIYGTYPTVFMALRKYEALKSYKAIFIGNVYYFIKYNDCIRYISFDRINPQKRIWGGRKDRIDAPHDMEELITIPISQLEELDEVI